MTTLLAVVIICGYPTLHNAFPQVLDYFPERADSYVDGYVAPADCSMMNSYFALHFGDKWWLVKEADCLNRSLEPKKGWMADVDKTIWNKTPPELRHKRACLIKLKAKNGEAAKKEMEKFTNPHYFLERSLDRLKGWCYTRPQIRSASP